MIIQFPTPYPDEILYSIVARYHIRSGNVFWKHTLEDLFGKRTISASVMLPSGIGSLVQHLPKNTTLNEQVLIEKHTMYPFYTVFLPKEKAQSIYNSMLSDDGKGIYMQSGIMASSIPQNKYLKYCSACAKEDIAMYGELYWHRLHQLPGKLICPKHELWLENSTIPINHSNKHVFILPISSNCDLTKARKANPTFRRQINKIIQQAEYLLNGRFKNQTFSHFTEFYRHQLIEKGFANFNGRVKQKELHEAFHNFFSNELLKCLYIKVGEAQWIADFSRKHRKAFNPYYHLLMLNFLSLNVNSVFRSDSFENNPFSYPKWPCLNALCPDYKASVIKDVTIRRCEKTKMPIGRFTCPNCGFSYTRKDKDQNNDDRYKYTRIMDFGFIWKKELLSLLNNELSYREIARRLAVDTSTVIKYEKIINKESDSKHFKDNDLVIKHRNEWLQLKRTYSDLTKTQLREKSPALYAFLYRNDRDWLNSNSPKRRKGESINNRVNWLKRDKELLERVQKVAREIRDIADKPVRITVKTLGDGIGQRALLEKHLDRMLETKVFIEEVSESEQDFRLRRVKYVINEMLENGEVIKEWKVLKRAAIKAEFYNEVKGIIKLYI